MSSARGIVVKATVVKVTIGWHSEDIWKVNPVELRRKHFDLSSESKPSIKNIKGPSVILEWSCRRRCRCRRRRRRRRSRRRRRCRCCFTYLVVIVTFFVAVVVFALDVAISEKSFSSLGCCFSWKCDDEETRRSSNDTKDHSKFFRKGTSNVLTLTKLWSIRRVEKCPELPPDVPRVGEQHKSHTKGLFAPLCLRCDNRMVISCNNSPVSRVTPRHWERVRVRKVGVARDDRSAKNLWSYPLCNAPRAIYNRVKKIITLATFWISASFFDGEMLDEKRRSSSSRRVLVWRISDWRNFLRTFAKTSVSCRASVWDPWRKSLGFKSPAFFVLVRNLFCGHLRSSLVNGFFSGWRKTRMLQMFGDKLRWVWDP